jgi:hypothetical protein
MIAIAYTYTEITKIKEAKKGKFEKKKFKKEKYCLSI